MKKKDGVKLADTIKRTCVALIGLGFTLFFLSGAGLALETATTQLK